MEKIYNETICGEFKCVIQKACREVLNLDIDFKITLKDETGKTATLMLNSTEMLISGDKMSGGNNK